MTSHDEFVKICESASLGKAPAEDLAKLERHVLECSSCWQLYHEDVRVAAHEFAAAAQNPKLSLKEAKDCLDSDLFVRRWFDRAEREGIAFSEEVRRLDGRRKRTPSPFSPPLLWKHFAAPMAIAGLLLLVLSTGYLHRKNPVNGPGRDSTSQTPSPVQSAKREMDVEAKNQSLMSEIDRLHRELADAENRLRVSEISDQKAIVEERKEFDAQRDVLQTQAAQLRTQLLQGQRELAQLQSIASNSQREADEQRKRAGANFGMARHPVLQRKKLYGVRKISRRSR